MTDWTKNKLNKLDFFKNQKSLTLFKKSKESNKDKLQDLRTKSYFV
jgi:hypothetical protein